MIWIFDSGSWWLTLLDELQKVLPQYTYLYFGDYNNCPYGDKSEQEIYKLTNSGVLQLKKRGAKLIILACNTAISNSIKTLQSNEKKLWIKILWVTIPAVEKVVEKNYKQISVLATNSSVKTELYKTRVNILNKNLQVQEIWIPNLAVLVEQFLAKKIQKTDIKKYIIKHTNNIYQSSEAIVLWCTHYSHIKDMFSELFPDKDIICPSYESALKLKEYLLKHTEIETKLEKKSKIYHISDTDTFSWKSEKNPYN